MSRVGKQIIIIPSGVDVNIDKGIVSVAGSKGNLNVKVLEGIVINQEGNTLSVGRISDDKKIRANHGLMRSLINNMVIGVSQGYSKKLEVIGVGYRVNLQGNVLKLSLGYSHEVNFPLP